MSKLELCKILSAIEQQDTLITLINNTANPTAMAQTVRDRAYVQRASFVYEAMGVAAKLGYVVGVRVDPADLTWPVCCIELPDAGEVSWHMPAYATPYAGYGTEEKYARVHAYIQGKSLFVDQ